MATTMMRGWPIDGINGVSATMPRIVAMLKLAGASAGMK